MTVPFLGQVNMYGFNFPPRGYALCTGQLVDISTNQALFSLLGTNYGGDGRSTFGYPDLRGRTPISMGTDVNQGAYYQMGQFGGVETVFLDLQELGKHTHAMQVTDTLGTEFGPNTGRVLGITSMTPLYAGSSGTSDPNLVALAASSVGSNGGGGSHTNVQPTIAVNFSICISGEYPSRN